MKCQSITERLNKECFCISLNNDELNSKFDTLVNQTGFSQTLRQSHPHLFSNVATFICEHHIEKMQQLINAVEKVTQNQQYQMALLAQSDAIAQINPAQKGVFYSYDFHLDESGPHLIEINTNAGGGLLNAYLTEAQHACCPEVKEFFSTGSDARNISAKNIAANIIQMFEQEWRLARGSEPLTSILILDDEPEKQGLYPEFLLFQSLFLQNGYQAYIASAKELSIKNNEVYFGDCKIDLIYNRLTGFYLAEPVHALIKDAYTHNLAVITPHPRAYSLHADKRALAILTDATQLALWGIEQKDIALFSECIPKTYLMSDFSEAELWEKRKQFFFKPFHGFGSKATYRGDKLTKSTFQSIFQQQDYIVQTFAQPSGRTVKVDDKDSDLKFDLRVYVYDAKIQLMAARLYQGQTTNMRTPGGGFSGVLVVPKIGIGN